MADLRIGVDLAVSVDQSALAAVEVVEQVDGRPPAQTWTQFYVVRKLQLWAPGTPIKVVVADTAELVREWGAPSDGDDITLVVDKTGLGQPVFELFLDAFKDGRMGPNPLPPLGVTITGDGTNPDWPSVPYPELVSRVHAAIAEDRLVIPRQPLRDTLLQQLGAIEASHTPTGRIHYGAPGTAVDDLAMAFMLALYPKPGDARFRWPDGYKQEPAYDVRPDGRWAYRSDGEKPPPWDRQGWWR